MGSAGWSVTGVGDQGTDVGAGVAGADILVSALQDIVTTIKSRETGEAHLVYLGDASVVASRQISASMAGTS